MALFPPLDTSPEEVRQLLSPIRNDFSIALCRCQNPFAVGAIVRVAHSFLAREVVIVGDDTHYAKASMGMEKYETIVRVPDEEAFLAHVKGRPVWAVEKDRARGSLYEVPGFPSGVVLAFGSERFGLPDVVLDAAKHVIGIPMYGINHSFPVTVAAGIVMAEWARRRYSPGTVVAGGSRKRGATQGR